MNRSTILALMLVCWGTLSFAQNPTPSGILVLDYTTRLQALEVETQEQIAVLSEQADANPAQRELIERQIIELKNQREIRRLEILLDRAESEDDQTKAAEIRKALDHWRNPAKSSNSQRIPRNAPDAPGIVPQSNELSR